MLTQYDVKCNKEKLTSNLDTNRSLVEQILAANNKRRRSSTNYFASGGSAIDKLIAKKNFKSKGKYSNIREKKNSEQQAVRLHADPHTAKNSKSILNYLEEMGGLTVAFDAFEHVVLSVKYSLKIHANVEYEYDSENQLFWFATIKYINGDLVYLKYLTKLMREESEHTVHSNEYFFTLASSNRIRPIGWCQKNSKTLHLPPEIESTSATPEIVEFIDYVQNESTNTHNTIHSFKNLLKKDQIYEFNETNEPLNVWFIKIKENFSGRLLVNYIDFKTLEFYNENFFWCFYLDSRLHPVGWCYSNTSYRYKPPESTKV